MSRGSPPATRMPGPLPPVSGAALSSSPATVLLVEDHPTVQLVVAEQLRQLGLGVQVAEDGHSALAAVRQRAFSLILMDCHLPGLSGYETTRRLREREAAEGLPHTPVIAISSATDAKHLEACMDCGMDGILKKPLQPDELQNLLGIWLGTGKIMAQEPARPFDPAADTGTLYKHAMAEDMAALQAAVAGGHHDAAIHFTHRIKGVALLAGAEPIVECAAQLENCLTQQAAQELAQPWQLLGRLQAELSQWHAEAA